MDIQEQINNDNKQKNNQEKEQEMINSESQSQQKQLEINSTKNSYEFLHALKDEKLFKLLSKTKNSDIVMRAYIFVQIDNRLQSNPKNVLTIKPTGGMIAYFTLITEVVIKQQQEKVVNNDLVFLFDLLSAIIGLTDQQKASQLKKKLFKNKQFISLFLKITIENLPQLMQQSYYKVSKSIIDKKLIKPMKKLCLQSLIRNLQYIKDNQIGKLIIIDIQTLLNSSKSALLDVNSIKKHNLLNSIEYFYVNNKDKQKSSCLIMSVYRKVRNKFPKLQITQPFNDYQKLQIRGKMKDQFIQSQEFQQNYLQYVNQYWELVSLGEIDRILDHYMKELNEISLLEDNELNNVTTHNQWLYFLLMLFFQLFHNKRNQETTLLLMGKGFIETILRLQKLKTARDQHGDQLSQFLLTCFDCLKSHSLDIYMSDLRLYAKQLSTIINLLTARKNNQTFEFSQLK